MNVEEFKKHVKGLQKNYEHPMLEWGAFFNEDLYEYGTMKAWEALRSMAEDEVHPQKAVFYIAVLGEVVNEVEESEPANLEPYREENLHALLRKISERMKQYKKSPFWECAGLAPMQAREVLLAVRSAMAFHPMNMPKAYVASLKSAKTWQDVVTTTFYFSQARALLIKELMGKGNVRGKLVQRAQMSGVVKI